MGCFVLAAAATVTATAIEAPGFGAASSSGMDELRRVDEWLHSSSHVAIPAGTAGVPQLVRPPLHLLNVKVGR